jgi:MoxR-like ATPase
MEQDIFKSRVDLSSLHKCAEDIRSEVKKVIVGQDAMVDLLLVAIFSKGHVLIEGVPGVAKTLTAKLLARTIHADFKRIQFTPDLMPSDVLGTSVFNPKTSEYEFRRGPIFSNIVLVDEINRAPAKTQAALFEVMEERQITNDGKTYVMNEPYLVLATQNPIEQEGTYRLPEAQLDRFLFKIVVAYPSLNEEVSILKAHQQEDLNAQLNQVQAVVNGDQLIAFRDLIRNVHVEEKIIQYVAQIAQETRANASLFLGASPRASVGLLNASKALAAIRGRDFVTPEDIKIVAIPALRHRLILTPEREMEGADMDETIKQIIDKIEIPR